MLLTTTQLLVLPGAHFFSALLTVFFRRRFELQGFPSRVLSGLNLAHYSMEEQLKYFAMIVPIALIMHPTPLSSFTPAVALYTALGSALVQMLRRPDRLKNSLGLPRRVMGPTYALATIVFARCQPTHSSMVAAVLVTAAALVYRPDNAALASLVHSGLGLPVPCDKQRTWIHGGLMATSLSLNVCCVDCGGALWVMGMGLASLGMYIGFVLLPRAGWMCKQVLGRLMGQKTGEDSETETAFPLATAAILQLPDLKISAAPDHSESSSEAGTADSSDGRSPMNRACTPDGSPRDTETASTSGSRREGALPVRQRQGALALDLAAPYHAVLLG